MGVAVRSSLTQAIGGRIPMFVERKAPGMELIDMLDRILDKGTVIDASVRLGLPGNDLRSMHARIVVDSIETYVAPEADPAVARDQSSDTLRLLRRDDKPASRKGARVHIGSRSRRKPA
jgi:Gas vesicle protein